MQYSKWYDKGFETSKLGFGCMRFTSHDDVVDKEKAIGLLRKAYQSGVTYFDTAKVYLGGQSEPIVGEALSIYPRESYFLATKFSLWSLKTEEEMDKMIEEQLEALKTPYIDFYLMHAMNKDRFEIMKERRMLEVVKKWKQEGKIKHIGFSFHDGYDAFKEILDYYDWEFCQIQYNYIDEASQQGLQGLKDLQDRHIPIIVMEPLKGGLLCNFNETIAKSLKDYNDDSLAKWALRYVWSTKGVMTLLSGMNEESQLEENLKLADEFTPLSEEETELVHKVARDLNSVQVVGCTGCKYCMPCPKEVNIPGNLRLLNQYEMYKHLGNVKYRFEVLEENGEAATKCIECGACLKKCPQHIDIPAYLKKVLDLVGKNSK